MHERFLHFFFQGFKTIFFVVVSISNVRARERVLYRELLLATRTHYIVSFYSTNIAGKGSLWDGTSIGAIGFIETWTESPSVLASPQISSILRVAYTVTGTHNNPTTNSRGP